LSDDAGLRTYPQAVTSLGNEPVTFTVRSHESSERNNSILNAGA